METTLIACAKSSLVKLQYQVVLRQERGKIKLNSVNIIIEDKTIKKIRQNDTSKRFTPKNAENIAIDYMTRNIVNRQKESIKKKSRKPTKADQAGAAQDLMKQFNL